MTNWVGIRLEQLDTLFFRDGRPFTATDKAHSRDIPMPQTIAGALRSRIMESLGCDFGRSNGEDKKIIREVMNEASIRGPWFVKGDQMLFATPATIVEESPDSTRADPALDMLRPCKKEIPGWRNTELKYPLWRRSITPARRHSSRFITFKGMKSFLSGNLPDNKEFVKAEDVFGFDRRTGIEIDSESLTAADSKIYGASMLSLKDDVRLYVEVSAREEWIAKSFSAKNTGLLKLGGEGRYVRTELMKKPLLEFGSSLSPSGGGAMHVLLTPALFGGWKPAGHGDQPVCASVPGYEAVSGWDLAKGGPKPARFAVSAGSIYFMDRAPEAGKIGSLCTGEDARLGYGIYAEGRFDYV